MQFLVRGIALWHFSVRSFQGLVVITTYDTEFYAVVRAVRHWRDYLFHREFIIFFDHEALRHLATQDKTSPLAMLRG